MTTYANKDCIIRGEKYRFTVLTSRLIRIEYNENGAFEDRATQIVANRSFPKADFALTQEDNLLTISTEHVELTYSGGEFTKNSLQVKYLGKNFGVLAGTISSIWGFGLDDPQNLGGTATTLDRSNGEIPLLPGLFSKCGAITTLDDSTTPVIDDDGTIKARENTGIDHYLFCYGDKERGNDFRAGLRDYYMLCGKTPLLPRFALGNWWSRYHPYTQEEYITLMKRFKKEDVPFSVAVIDIDWHHIKIDPKYGSGWTGYSWNRELFPDHVEFLKTLHEEGLHTSLNVHPQEGVSAHEDAYPDMARAMGVDPATEQNIPFEIENPKFMKNYFDHLHAPQEEDGVDFWWIDWQQGNTTRIPGIDPLWMLNHFHYRHSERNGDRGLIFSRFAGPGSHRYPVGFSGDTVISWESLDFQPYFTATASNIGYSWWSHDIGGHMYGERSEELITRWFQLGVFSPINRLHSMNSPFLGKEPWKYNKISELSMKKFLKLRHELIPYLYTMNRRTSEFGEPIVSPLYYDYPDERAYECRNEFSFGTEMIVSPITSPHDEKTTMGSVRTYIPDGVWYDFFSNLRYRGGKTLTLFRNLYDMPVLVKAGGIVPLAKLSHVNDTENPKDLKLRVFSGASNTFELYEDDGRANPKSATTKFELDWTDTPTFKIGTPQGDAGVIPEGRTFEVEFVGICDCDVRVFENGKSKNFEKTFDDGVLTVDIGDAAGEIEISLASSKLFENNIFERACEILEKFEYTPNRIKDIIYNLLRENKDKSELMNDIIQFGLDEKVTLALYEIICAD